MRFFKKKSEYEEDRHWLGMFLLIFLLFTPLWMWLGWVIQSERPLNLLVLDKTVPDFKRQEHRALAWVLLHRKFTGPTGKLFDINRDYFGFFPLENEQYRLNGLEQFDSTQIDSLAQLYQAAFFTDTYGVYENEWYRHRNLTERSRQIYGGTRVQDVWFLRHMKEQRKLVILEFNTVGAETPAYFRKQIEKMFRFRWSGWSGRYFEVLDTLKNPELPRWIVRLYKKEHHNRWPFTGDGIVLVHASEKVEILDGERDLKHPFPQIVSTPAARHRFHLPEKIDFAYWFDIVIPDKGHHLFAEYRLETTARGDSILMAWHIPNRFPAVFGQAQGMRFYYFAGDFSDNPISLTTAHLRWIEYFRGLLYTRQPLDRTRFFWQFYRPLVTTILQEYQRTLISTKIGGGNQ